MSDTDPEMFMDRIFDRQGRPITTEEWSRLGKDRSYKVLKQTTVGVHWISTVWLGLDHGFGRHDKPVIFETMVFDQGPEGEAGEVYQGMRTIMDGDDYRPWSEMDSMRYETEAEAFAGHEAMVEKWNRPQ